MGIRLTKKQFADILKKLVGHINDTQGEGFYTLKLIDGTSCHIIPQHGTFGSTYLDEFLSLQKIYNVGITFVVLHDKPCLWIYLN